MEHGHGVAARAPAPDAASHVRPLPPFGPLAKGHWARDRLTRASGREGLLASHTLPWRWRWRWTGADQRQEVTEAQLRTSAEQRAIAISRTIGRDDIPAPEGPISQADIAIHAATVAPPPPACGGMPWAGRRGRRRASRPPPPETCRPAPQCHRHDERVAECVWWKAFAGGGGAEFVAALVSDAGVLCLHPLTHSRLLHCTYCDDQRSVIPGRSSSVDSRPSSRFLSCFRQGSMATRAPVFERTMRASVSVSMWAGQR